MPVTDDFAEFVLDQLAPLRGVASGRFFSGTGFSVDGVQFGMIIQGTLYFVVDDSTRAKYEARGSRCFSYDTKKRRVDVRRYYSVSADLIEDQEELVLLAREAARIASLSKRTATPRKHRPRTKKVAKPK